MLRWTIRIVLVFVVLVTVAAAIVHVILPSDWLRGVILSRVSEETGMNVVAESLDIGWSGRTTIRKAIVRMPLSDEVVLTADRIEIMHEILPLLILGRPVNVWSVEVDNPQLNLRQYESGRWNAEDLWSRLRASFDSADARDREVMLPRLAVRDATVRIAEPNRTPLTVGPLGFRAHPQGKLAWLFDLRLPEAVGIEGRMVQGRDWAHEISFAAGGMEPLIRHLFERDLSPIQVAGRWQGKVLGSTLDGTLRLDKLAVGRLSLRGGARIEANPDQFTLCPLDMVLGEPNLAGEEIRLMAGVVRITRKRVNIEQLTARTSQLRGRVSGHWDLDAQVGELAGSWTTTPDAVLPRCHGTYQASMKSPPFGRKEAELSVSTEAETSFGQWSVAATVKGVGADWRQSRWRISIPAFVWSRNERQVDLTGGTAEIRLEWPEFQLTALHVPKAKQARGGARFNADTRRWSAHFEVDDLRLETLRTENLDLSLSAEGDTRAALISELRVEEGERTVTAKGELSFHERGLRGVRLVADWPADRGEPEKPQTQQPAGYWHLEADVSGRVQPLAVDISGELTGQNISLGKRVVSRVKIPVEASVDAERIEVATRPFDLLGGVWRFSGQHELFTEVTQVGIVADGLSLEAAAGMAGLPLASQGQVHAEMQLVVPGFDARKAVATGHWSARDVNIPPLEAERARGTLRIAGGLVRFEEIILEQGGGQAEASMEFRLDDPQVLSVELRTEEWPMRLGDRPVSLFADSEAKLRLNILERTVNGGAQISGKIVWADEELARIRASALVDGQTLEVQELRAEALGGIVEGMARIPVNHWVNSAGQLRWQGIQPKRLEQWVPQFERFEGVVRGSLVAEPVAEAVRPPEPVRLVLDADVEDGRFGPAQIGGCHIIGYLGESRLLIDQASFRVLAGQFNARARVSRHVHKHYASVAADFNDLNLDQIAHVIDANAAAYVGLVSGQATILSSSDLDALGGEARIRLSKSDLAGNGVVRVLYDTLNLNFGKQQPTGTGEILIRLEGPSVFIPSIAYFNRGVEIRGAAQVKNINLGAESPVEGYAVASTRVLKGVELPGVDSLDRLLATFQTGAASVKIGGTFGDVGISVVPLPIVLNSFRRLLWAQLRG